MEKSGLQCYPRCQPSRCQATTASATGRYVPVPEPPRPSPHARVVAQGPVINCSWVPWTQNCVTSCIFRLGTTLTSLKCSNNFKHVRVDFPARKMVVWYDLYTFWVLSTPRVGCFACSSCKIFKITASKQKYTNIQMPLFHLPTFSSHHTVN